MTSFIGEASIIAGGCSEVVQAINQFSSVIKESTPSTSTNISRDNIEKCASEIHGISAFCQNHK